MYSFTYDIVENSTDDKQIMSLKKVAKGISNCEIKKTLRHEMYKNCLFEETSTINSMRCIRRKNHELYIDTIVKKGLCSFDNKSYWKNSNESYAFGHHKFSEN